MTFINKQIIGTTIAIIIIILLIASITIYIYGKQEKNIQQIINKTVNIMPEIIYNEDVIQESEYQIDDEFIPLIPPKYIPCDKKSL